MAFKFYIDGQLTDQPVNDTALRTTIRRDQGVGGIVITQDADLTWNGNNAPDAGVVSGYNLFKTAFDVGQCDELEIIIYDEISAQQTIQLYNGVIKVPSIQIDEQRVLASVKVQDNNFYSYINNNKSIEYNVQSTNTKNRLTITPPQIYEVDCFNSDTGVYGSTVGDLYRGYRVYDVFEYIISALSDNKIGFQSILLATDPVLFIFDGFALANPKTDPNVITSFSKLFEEVNKIKNIAFYIDLTDETRPLLKIEEKSTLFSGYQVFSFDDIKEILSRIKTDNIYATIKVGASDNPGGSDPTVWTFNAGTSYVGWSEESYAPFGQCNADNELNLVNEYGITHNDVNNQVVGAVTSNLDKMFLIECENVDTALFTADALQYSSWVGGNDVYYNKGTNNPAKLLKWGSNYQSVVTNTLEIGGNGFQASLGQESIIGSYNPASPFFVGGSGNNTQPIIFADETSGNNYDGSGNYNNITGIYVASSDGLYSFNTDIIYDTVDIKVCPLSGNSVGFFVAQSPVIPAGNYYTEIRRGFLIDLSIKVYSDNTLTTLLSTETKRFRSINNQFAETISISDAVNLTTGNAVISSVNIIANAFAPAFFGNLGIENEVNNTAGWSIAVFGCVNSSPFATIYASENSKFACTGSPDGGGITVANDPLLYKNKEFEFQYDISQTEWDNIKKNPTGLFGFEKDGITRFGWIDTMQRNDWTGMTNIKLITNNALTTQ